MRRVAAENSPARGSRVGLSVLLLAILCALGLRGATATYAAVPSPHWMISSLATPTSFRPGDPGDVYTLIVTNNGSRPTDGSAVTVVDTLPHGVTATEISGEDRGPVVPLQCSLATLSCTDPAAPTLASQDYLIITIKVAVGNGPPASVTNSAEVYGGGAPSAVTSAETPISPTPAPFGITSFTAHLTDASGAELTQAGAHPYEMITDFAFSSSLLDLEGFAGLSASARDINIALPPGLLGNFSTLPRCTQNTFQTVARTDNCPAVTQVGQVVLMFYGGGTPDDTIPVYAIEPPPGQPVELGFTIASFIHVPMFFTVRSDGDYGLTANLNEVPETDPIRVADFSFWGVPAAASHDLQRDGPGCAEGCPSEATPNPFLTLPTSCPGEPLRASVLADSWQAIGRRNADGQPDLTDPSWVSATTSLPSTTGCEKLSSHPSISVQPDSEQAGVPSGYAVGIHIPQNFEPNGLATPSLRVAKTILPLGAVISPSSTNGLESCSDDAGSAAGDQFGLHRFKPASCPAGSQIGTIKFVSPLLTDPLEGQAFIGKPLCGPCDPADVQAGRMVRLLLQARGSGVIVKVAGSVAVDQVTGQLTTTFDDSPRLAFTEQVLTFNGGPRSPIVNPNDCDAPATTTMQLTSWSSPFTPIAIPTSSFQVSGCESPTPFAPRFEAGALDSQAGAFSPFTLTIARGDHEQNLGRISLQAPPGLLGMVSRVPICGEPQAQEGKCSAQSRIGHVMIAAGAGTEPVWLGGELFLTGPYGGMPFGLSIVVPVKAGPFDLGTEVVRAAIAIDPHTAQLTMESDSLPLTRDGIPLQIQTLSVNVDREGFLFNPTNCESLAVSGTIGSIQGASAYVANHFQSTNCATLPFKPSITASSRAKTTRANGASLDIKVHFAPGPQANIRSFAVDLPKQLPARLTTIQKACRAAVFDINPAGCPAGSAVGTAIVLTPVLNVPLRGPVFLVSHGGAAFPDLVVVLQGQGVTLDLGGSLKVSRNGITSSRFASVPDAPISSFELTLPAGPHSILAAYLPAKAKGNLCASKLVIPTLISAQNGAQLKQSTPVKISGCKVRHKTRKRARKR